MHNPTAKTFRLALLRTVGTALVAASACGLAVSASATASTATGTLQAYKGGYRNVGDSSALNYALPLSGAGFEYAQSGSGVFTPFPALSDAAGLVSKSNLANGGWKARETTSPSGWSGFSQLHWDGSDRDYVGTASLNSDTQTAYIQSTAGGTTRHSDRFVNAFDNPPLPSSCNVGLKVLMLLDTSGSTSGYNDDYRKAAQTFVNELYGTNTTMKISSFATTISSGNSTTYDLNTATGKTDANNRIQSIYPTNTSGSGATNWDAILQDAAQANVNVVVFVTDGNPTVRVTVPQSDTGGNETGIDDITYAVASANLAKNPDMKGSANQTMLGVGVGGGISEVNMKAVTGPNKGTDYVISPTPTELTAILKAIAGKLCPGQLTVTKKLVPSDDPGLFDLKVDGVVKKADAGNGGTTGALTLDAGSHSIGEAAGTGTSLDKYSSATKCTDSGGADVPITDGKINLATDAKVTCVITNTRNTGTITVEKSLVPSSDPGLFNLLIGGDKYATDVGDGGTTGYQTFNTGTYAIDESAGTDTSLSDYTNDLACEDSKGPVKINDGKVDLAKDQKIDCTITNTRNTGTITVDKNLVPSDDPGLFNLSIGGKDYATDVGDGGTTGKQTLNTGSYTIGETAGTATTLNDYTTKLACQDEEGPVTVKEDKVNLTDAQNITCTFTNTRNTGTITVNKSLSPASDPGLFNLAIAGKDYATDIGDGGTTGKQTLNTGTYAITESAGTNTTLDDYTSKLACDDGEESIPVTEQGVKLLSGQDITCTFTNTRLTGTVKLVKSLSPASDSGRFNLQLDGATQAAAVGDGGASGTLSVNTGSHTISEVAADGTSLADYTSSASCEVGGQVIASGEVTTLEVSVASEQAVTCTFTNTRKEIPPPPNGTITIVKNVSSGPAGSFAFTGSLGDFTLTGGSSTSFSRPAGSYSVTESAASGFVLESIVCSDAGEAGGSSSISGTAATISLQAGETVVCTWTNGPSGAVVDPAIAGSARVSGSQGCVRNRYAYVRVRGGNIARVSFFASGKRISTLTERNSRGRYYELRYPVSRIKPGASKRITATVLFVSGAEPQATTLRWRVVRCAAKVKPGFTG
jgi:hypothetical protein